MSSTRSESSVAAECLYLAIIDTVWGDENGIDFQNYVSWHVRNGIFSDANSSQRVNPWTCGAFAVKMKPDSRTDIVSIHIPAGIYSFLVYFFFGNSGKTRGGIAPP